MGGSAVDHTLSHIEHAAFAKLADDLLCLFHAHLAQNLVHPVETIAL